MITEIKGLLSASNVYIGSQPDSPDNVVTIYASGGFEASSSGTKVREPTFQIRVRNSSYATGRTACETVIEELHNAKTTNILVIFLMGDINDIGRDEQNRQEFTMNFRCYFRRN